MKLIPQTPKNFTSRISFRGILNETWLGKTRLEYFRYVFRCAYMTPIGGSVTVEHYILHFLLGMNLQKKLFFCW